MTRVYNFSAGPAVLPEEVLQEAAAEMLDYNGTGMGVMEMSHRSKAYQQIIDEAEADLRQLTVSRRRGRSGARRPARRKRSGNTGWRFRCPGRRKARRAAA